jgi:hypothetical protein
MVVETPSPWRVFVKIIPIGMVLQEEKEKILENLNDWQNRSH